MANTDLSVPAAGDADGSPIDEPSTGAMAESCPTGANGSIDESGRRRGRSPNFVRGMVEWLVVIVGSIVVALILRAFVFQAFWIPTESMESTLDVNDRVLVNKLSYRVGDIQRGDVVVFDRPEGQIGDIDELIKRVIGLAGETIEGRDNEIYIDGELLLEPYLGARERTGDFGPVTVPRGHMFVMGDNRDQSFDSRFFGSVSIETVVGRAFVLFWPLDRISGL